MKNTLLALLVLIITLPALAQKEKATDFYLDEVYAFGENGTVYLSADDADISICVFLA